MRCQEPEPYFKVYWPGVRVPFVACKYCRAEAMSLAHLNGFRLISEKVITYKTCQGPFTCKAN